mmetsp:Transcript_2220/g.2838  ORF Transcript_2220/g.2838 Transcript_2220/m.2838 type:complete len:325 (+) Transcript_2220:2-976(+)
MPLQIYVSHNNRTYNRGGDGWEYAKWVWKVSMFTFVTLHDHLLVAHLLKAGALAKCSREHLPVDHLLRILLKPFSFFSIYINQLAGRTLYCPNGLAARVWAFKDVTKVMNDLADKYTYDDDFVKLKNEGVENYPIENDYRELNRIITKYVKDSIDQLHDLNEVKDFYLNLVEDLKVSDLDENGLRRFNRTNLIRVLSHLIMNGTGIHEHVGHIADYQIFPNLTGSKIVEGMLREPTQSYALNASLTASTGIKQPMLLDDWIFLLEKNIPNENIRNQAVANYKEFKRSLVEMSQNIEERSSQRRKAGLYEFVNFNPRYLETAVSK